MGRHLLPDHDLLARLVSFDSTSRNSNLPVADFLADYLDRPGVHIAHNLSADGAKSNLLVWAGSDAADDATSRHGLVLSGHMDVVPADEEGWTSDPFTLTDAGDRWVGRGACDMKGFLAVAANVFAHTAVDRLCAPLVLVYTYDEEVGTLGARRLYESYINDSHTLPVLPASAIIGEPTSMRVARLHKGHLKMRVTLTGIPAHSGYPHLGKNAIEPAARVVEALAQLRRALEGEEAPYHELFSEVPYVPLNVGTIHGGSAINVVPDRCVVELGLRPLPGMRSEDLAERVRGVVRAAAAPFVPTIEVLSDSPPMFLPPQAPIITYLTALLASARPSELSPTLGESVSFATDAGWLSRLGLDCAIWGPGSIEVAHKPNEFVPKSELAAARDLLATTVRHFCGVGGGA